jgi:hypothetical protein
MTDLAAHLIRCRCRVCITYQAMFQIDLASVMVRRKK